MVGVGLEDVSVFQDGSPASISALDLAGPRTWVGIPKCPGVSSVRYLDVSGRAPGGSHCPIWA